MTIEFPRALRVRVIMLSLQGYSIRDIANELMIGETFLKKIRKIYK
jgi:transposase-like protein